MPHLTWSRRALNDLSRLELFLKPKNSRAAKRAIVTIREALHRVEAFPGSGRPVVTLDPSYRDVLVEFGTNGYIVRYKLESDMIVVVRVRHMRELDF